MTLHWAAEYWAEGYMEGCLLGPLDSMTQAEAHALAEYNVPDQEGYWRIRLVTEDA